MTADEGAAVAPTTPAETLEALARDTGAAEQTEMWHLRLYVAGQSPKSIEAFTNLKHMCDTHLAGRYDIEVIDLLKNPRLARGDEIIAIPTVVRQLPDPMRKIIGDLSDTDRVLIGLQLKRRT